LVDGDSRGEAAYHVIVRLFHLADELPGVGGERLHIATLTFGKNSVESQAGFTGSGNPGENDQFLFWQLYINVLQVVFPSASDQNGVQFRVGPDPESTGIYVEHRFCLTRHGITL